MSGVWPKVFSDPIHKLIAFENTPSDRLLLDLINSREVQRLRRIKQLGLAELVFPGANQRRIVVAGAWELYQSEFDDFHATASGVPGAFVSSQQGDTLGETHFLPWNE